MQSGTPSVPLKNPDLDTFVKAVTSRPEWASASSTELKFWNNFQTLLLQYINLTIKYYSPFKKNSIQVCKKKLMDFWKRLIEKNTFANLDNDTLEFLTTDFNNECVQLTRLFQENEDALNDLVIGLESAVKNFDENNLAAMQILPTLYAFGNNKYNLTDDGLNYCYNDANSKIEIYTAARDLLLYQRVYGNVTPTKITELEEGLKFYKAKKWDSAINQFQRGIDKIQLLPDKENYLDTILYLKKNLAYTFNSSAIELSEKSDIKKTENHARSAVLQMLSISDEDMNDDAENTLQSYSRFWKNIFYQYCKLLEKNKDYLNLITMLISVNELKVMMTSIELKDIKTKLGLIYNKLGNQFDEKKLFSPAVEYLNLAINEGDPADRNFFQYNLAKIYYNQATVAIGLGNFKDGFDRYLSCLHEFKKLPANYVEQAEKDEYLLDAHLGLESSLIRYSEKINNLDEKAAYHKAILLTATQDKHIQWSINKAILLDHLLQGFNHFCLRQYDAAVSCFTFFNDIITAYLIQHQRDINSLIVQSNCQFNYLLLQLEIHQQILNVNRSKSVTSDLEFEKMINRFIGHIYLTHAQSLKLSMDNVDSHIVMLKNAITYLDKIPVSCRIAKDIELMMVALALKEQTVDWLRNTVLNLILKFNNIVRRRMTFYNENEESKQLKVYLKEFSTNINSFEAYSQVSHLLKSSIIAYPNMHQIELIKNIAKLVDCLIHAVGKNTQAEMQHGKAAMDIEMPNYYKKRKLG